MSPQADDAEQIHNAETHDAIPELTHVTKKSWLATAVSSVGMGFDAYVINLPVIMVVPLGLLYDVPAERIAAVQTVFMAGYLLGTLAFSTLADVLGRRITLALSIAGYAVAAALTGLAPTLTIFIVARFITGILAGGEQSVGVIFAMEAWPRKWRGWGSANMFTLYPLGAAVLIIVAALPLPISDQVHVRLAFFLALPIGIAILWFRHHIIESDAFLQTKKKIASEEGPKKRNSWRSIGAHPVLRRRWIGALVINIANNFTYHGFSVALILYLTEVHGFDHFRVMLIILPMYLIQIFACLLGAYLSDILGRRPVAIAAYVIGAIATVAMLNLENLTHVLIAAGIAQVALLGPGWATMLTTTAEIFPTEVRGAGMAMTLGIGRIGAFAAPATLTALIPLMGMENVMYIYIASMLVSVIGFMSIPDLKNKPIYHLLKDVPWK